MFGEIGIGLTRQLTPRAVKEGDFADLLTPTEAEMGAQSLDLVGSVVRLLGALGLVLALLMVCLWLLRRFGGRWGAGAAPGGDGIDVLQQRSLGGRRHLTIIRWEGRRLLLGVTPESITTLASQSESDDDTQTFEATIDEVLQSGLPAQPLAGSGSRR